MTNPQSSSAFFILPPNVDYFAIWDAEKDRFLSYDADEMFSWVKDTKEALLLNNNILNLLSLMSEGANLHAKEWWEVAPELPFPVVKGKCGAYESPVGEAHYYIHRTRGFYNVWAVELKSDFFPTRQYWPDGFDFMNPIPLEKWRVYLND